MIECSYLPQEHVPLIVRQRRESPIFNSQFGFRSVEKFAGNIAVAIAVPFQHKGPLQLRVLAGKHSDPCSHIQKNPIGVGSSNGYHCDF